MKTMYLVNFLLKTDTSGIFTESCQSTVFADSYDDAANQVQSIFGSFAGFKLTTIRPIGCPIVPDVKELKQINQF